MVLHGLHFEKFFSGCVFLTYLSFAAFKKNLASLKRQAVLNAILYFTELEGQS